MSYKVKRYELGDIIETKKPHPCGSKEWKINRVGADFKIECLKCKRIVMLPRSKFEKSVKRVIEAVGDNEIKNND